MITKSCWKGSCKIIEVIQSEVFLVDVYSLARSLADAYKVKSGEELPYQSLEVMLFYAWWLHRHFARYENGKVFVWADGATSWTTEDTVCVSWKCARLCKESK